MRVAAHGFRIRLAAVGFGFQMAGVLLGLTKELGLTPTGVVNARMQIKPEGGVSSVTFDPGTLTDVGLLSCLKDSFKRWNFPKTARLEPITMTLSLRLDLTKERTPMVSLNKGSPKLLGEGYDLSSEDILSVFRKNASNMRLCYDELRKRQPKATGQVAVDLVVNAQGRVGKVGFRELAFGDDAFRACLSKQISLWRFPKPRSGEPVTVKYPPFQFSVPQ